MDIKEHLARLEAAHSEQVHAAQIAQTNVWKLEGAITALRGLITEAEAEQPDGQSGSVAVLQDGKNVSGGQ